MLPLVRSITGDIVQRFREAAELKERLSVLESTRREAIPVAHREEVEQIERECEKKEQSLQEAIDELRALGVDFKGPDGLVDFPAQMDGREVFLCWKLGEPEVMHWHELDAGFAGRQPLPALATTER